MLDRLELTSRSMAKGLEARRGPVVFTDPWPGGGNSPLRLHSSELLSLEVQKQISNGSQAIRGSPISPPPPPPPPPPPARGVIITRPAVRSFRESLAGDLLHFSVRNISTFGCLYIILLLYRFE